MIKNSPANAGEMGLTPVLGKFHMLHSNQACAPQPLNLCLRVLEPQLLRLRAAAAEALAPGLQSTGFATRETTTERRPHISARE